MQICVFGAGAIGGHLAVRMAQGGADVSAVARGAQLAAIRARGLRAYGVDFDATAKIAASDNPADLGPQDVVFVTTKAPALPAVAAAIAPLLKPDTPVVFVMNGIPWWYFYAEGSERDGTRLPRIDPDNAVWNAIGPQRAIGGVVYSACTVVEPGVIHATNKVNRLVVGEPDNQISARLEALAEPLRRGGFVVDTTDRIRDAIWTKLMLNLTSGCLCIPTLSAPKYVYPELPVQEALRRITAEGAAIAQAVGCNPKIDIEAQLAFGLQSSHKPSIVQDLELGRPMEIDAMFTAPLQLARMTGVATPTLDLLVSLAKVRARAAGLYAF
jgi:2-dehydropantoate 2-reductase